MNWDHLDKETASGMRRLEHIAENAKNHNDQIIALAGEGLLYDLRSVARNTRHIADRLGAMGESVYPVEPVEPVEPPENPGDGWVKFELWAEREDDEVSS